MERDTITKKDRALETKCLFLLDIIKKILSYININWSTYDIIFDDFSQEGKIWLIKRSIQTLTAVRIPQSSIR